jgi:hypothetical protein
MKDRKRRVLIFLIGFVVGMILNFLISSLTKNTPEATANEFLMEYYTITNYDLAGLLENSVPANTSANDDSLIIAEVAGFEEALQNKYGALMTEGGLKKAVANRIIPAGELAAKKSGSKLYVIDTKLTEIEISDEHRIYKYNVTAMVSHEDEIRENTSLDGHLYMKKVDENWKVDRFNPSKGQLTRILEIGAP